MKLRTKLVLTTTVTSLVILGVSEWLSYRETMEFFGAHLAEMGRDSSTPDSAQSLKQGMTALGERLIWIHFAHAALEVLALVAVLTLFWSKFVLSPIRKILNQMNSMGYSVACQALSLDREDEIGQMASELDRLGGKLSTALEHTAAASELAALALMGRTLVRKVSTAGDQLAGALRAVAKAQKDASAPPDTAVASLEAVLARLSSLPDLFEAEFEKRLDERRHQPAEAPAFDDVLTSRSGVAAARQ